MDSFRSALEVVIHPENYADADRTAKTMGALISDRERDLLRSIQRELTYARREQLVLMALEAMDDGDHAVEVSDSTVHYERAHELLRAWEHLATEPLNTEAVRLCVRNET